MLIAVTTTFVVFFVLRSLADPAGRRYSYFIHYSTSRLGPGYHCNNLKHLIKVSL